VTWSGNGVQIDPVMSVRSNGADLRWQHFPGATSAYANAVLADSPVGYWRLGEAAGSTSASDFSGNSITAAIQNSSGATRAEPARLVDADTATKFHGSPAGYVDVPDATAIRVNDTFTLEAWVRRSDLTARDMALFNDFGAGFWLRIGTNHRLELLRNDTSALIVSSTITIEDTDWHHIAATKQGATVKLWVDGIDVTGTVTNQTLTSSTQGFHVANSDGVGLPFYGWVDEAAVYPTALSEARVRAHMDAALVSIAGFKRFEVHRSTASGFTPSAGTLIATLKDPGWRTYADTTGKAATTFY
jgi:hypothetical protein